jgi:Xaa-Pro aminopeptidase
MRRDDDRRRITGEAVRSAGLAAVACTLPSNVLLATGGYWPVVGASLALVAADGRVAIILPEDERDELEAGFADVVRTYKPASLDDLRTAAEAIDPVLVDAAGELGLTAGARVGYERGADTLPHSYVAVHLYRTALRRLVRGLVPGVRLSGADDLLRRLRSRCTPAEVARVRRSCETAGVAFQNAKFTPASGRTEVAVAAAARVCLAEDGNGRDDGMVWVMSGPRSAAAAGAFARSSAAVLRDGELALVHCNNQVGGYWTDVTRTFCLGEPNDERRRWYEAVSAARAAAFSVIRPGVTGGEVDAAARRTLERRGFGNDRFTHPTGHGVPFAAIAGSERPRIHPRSTDVLEVGSVFNIEPAIYVAGVQGMRHCDVVAVTDGGAEVLTPWLSDPAELWLNG